jgi:hypothetical protein
MINLKVVVVSGYMKLVSDVVTMCNRGPGRLSCVSVATRECLTISELFGVAQSA